MKVCHMTSVHPAEDVRIFHKECVSLAQAGYEVYLVQRGESGEKNGVHIVGVGEIPTRRLKRMTEGAKKVYEAALALDCDLYHLHDPELLPYGMKLKKKGKKVVFDSHENTAGAILEKSYIPMFFRELIHRKYADYEASIVRQLDAVITVTPTQTAYFRAINPNTVEVANFPVLTERYQMPQFERKALVFAGGISSQWNHHVVVRALEQLPDAVYVLCGGENAYLNSLRQLPGWDRVDYLGRVAHEQVAQIMSSCMVGLSLLQPGRNTAGQTGTMGNTKIFEEMMAGLPIVCTDFTLWRSFVDEYKCGICVDPSDEQAIISAISYLLDHPDQAREMGENGRRAVKERFNWEVEQENLLALYRHILDE